MYDWRNKITHKIKFINIYFKPLLENGKVGGYKIYQNPKFEELITYDWLNQCYIQTLVLRLQIQKLNE